MNLIGGSGFGAISAGEDGVTRYLF